MCGKAATAVLDLQHPERAYLRCYFAPLYHNGLYVGAGVHHRMELLLCAACPHPFLAECWMWALGAASFQLQQLFWWGRVERWWALTSGSPAWTCASATASGCARRIQSECVSKCK
eukprot:scaffold42658_cov19-Tisochrysis_lutea.AAC.1